MMQGDHWLHQAVSDLGGRIVLDATESGELGLAGPIDRRHVDDDPLGELASAYFGHIPHPFRRPNSAFYSYMARELPSRGVRGILFRRYVWCDTWHGELGRLREWASERGMGVSALRAVPPVGGPVGREDSFHGQDGRGTHGQDARATTGASPFSHARPLAKASGVPEKAHGKPSVGFATNGAPGIPVVDLDFSEAGGDHGRILQRVQAMIETLQQAEAAR